MSDVPRLLEAFATGRLQRPSADVPNTVDLARAIASLCGVPDLELTSGAKAISERIGTHDHIVLVLVDGLGMNLIEREMPDGFFGSHVAMELQSVVPSSTAPALTSIATGLWPAAHAVPGWYTYLPDPGITATILPFIERYSKKSARKHGATPQNAFPAEPLPLRMTRDQLRVMPKRLDGSLYSRYSSGEAPGIGYTSLRTAVADTCAYIEHADGPTYTYLYTSFVDTAEHKRGTDSKAVRRALKLVQTRIEMLAEKLVGRARIIVTADHGQIDIVPTNQTVLANDDPLLDLLLIPPTCEPRIPAFHVREGQHAAFEQQFRERFAEQFALLAIDELNELQLFGPVPLSLETRRRLGDYVGVAIGLYALLYRPEHPMIGFHGGLQRDEMRIPLIIA